MKFIKLLFKNGKPKKNMKGDICYIHKTIKQVNMEALSLINCKLKKIGVEYNPYKINSIKIKERI